MNICLRLLRGEGEGRRRTEPGRKAAALPAGGLTPSTSASAAAGGLCLQEHLSGSGRRS